MFLPVMNSENDPSSARSNRHPVTSARAAPPVPPVPVALQVNVTCTPCSLPSGHPGGAPATAVVMFRLVPFGPDTKIKNVFPLFTLPKLNNASIRFALMITKFVALILVAVFARSSANTDVTFGTPLIMKQAPVINTSCGIPQLPFDGDTENTIGALAPNANAHTAVRVNGPNTLLSAPVNVVVTVTVPAPPQHAAGNPLDDVVPNVGDTGIVARTRLQLTGVTLVSATTDSGIPSPFVSHASVAAVVTVLPGRCSGTPVSSPKP